MKAYKVAALAKPAEKHFKEYASLLAEDKVFDWLNTTREFNGKPFSKDWKRQELYIDNLNLPRPDFFYFLCGGFVCNERALKFAGEALEMSGELLPIKIERDKGEYWLHNITHCPNVVDREKSWWKSNGQILEKPVFIAERLGEESLFKLSEDYGAIIYCLERTGDPDEGEFKAVVEKNKLTGLEFELVWTDE